MKKIGLLILDLFLLVLFAKLIGIALVWNFLYIIPAFLCLLALFWTWDKMGYYDFKM